MNEPTPEETLAGHAELLTVAAALGLPVPAPAGTIVHIAHAPLAVGLTANIIVGAYTTRSAALTALAEHVIALWEAHTHPAGRPWMRHNPTADEHTARATWTAAHPTPEQLLTGSGIPWTVTALTVQPSTHPGQP
jgi:hypothetical protein